MTMWTVVIPHEPQTAAAGGPCLDRDFLFDVSLSLSLSLSLSFGRQEVEECLLQLFGWTAPSNHSPCNPYIQPFPAHHPASRSRLFTNPANRRTATFNYSICGSALKRSYWMKKCSGCNNLWMLIMKVFPQFPYDWGFSLKGKKIKKNNSRYKSVPGNITLAHSGWLRKTVKLPKCGHMMPISPVLVSALSSYLPPSPRKQTRCTYTPSRCSSASPQHLTSKLICATPIDTKTQNTIMNALYQSKSINRTGSGQRSDHFCYCYRTSCGVCNAFFWLAPEFNFFPLPSWWYITTEL